MKTQTEIMLRERGLIKEADAVEKTANILDDMYGHITPEEIHNMINAVVGLGAAAATYAVHGAVKTKMEQNSVRNNIINMGKELQQDPMFASAPAKAKARLYEIARIAPHVTLNKELTKSIIKSKLHNGLTDEDKQNLVMLQSQYHSDPNVSSFMPKVASAQLGEILADVVMIKEAGKSPSEFKNSLMMFGAAATMPLLAGLIGGAVNMGMAHMKQRNLKNDLENSYMKALSISDVDKEPLMQNKDKAREAFSTLARFAPQVALDPQAARSFMNKIVSYDQGIDTSSVKELSEISKNLSYGKPDDAFAVGFDATSKYVGAPNVMAPAFAGLSDATARSIYTPKVKPNAKTVSRLARPLPTSGKSTKRK